MSARPTGAVALAQRSWRLLHQDASASGALADRALARARADADVRGLGWALLARGFHDLYFALPAQAQAALEQAAAQFERAGDRAGWLLASAGIGRAMWRSGRVQAALDWLLPLRDEGLALLKHEQRGVLLNAIAGCYSAQGKSEEAFAYMYEALREAGPSRGHGFDAALHCNLSHELMQLGDHDEALVQVERGLERCASLANAKLLSVLLINRVICLMELGRPAEALPSVRQVIALPEDASGRGVSALHHEALALVAFRAGEVAFGRELLARARAEASLRLADERVELAIAEALDATLRGDTAGALAVLDAAAPLVDDARAEQGEAASLRVRCLHAQVRSELLESSGDAAAALAAVRRWQRLNGERARLASRARYQAAALQTELMTLKHRLEENDAKRRAIERSSAELAAANRQLEQRMAEIEALQARLREQATHDALTGLANRRHLNDTLPQMLALALRERAPLAAVVIDLDRFKAVNDDHGHPAGDALLAGFGQLLRAGLRGSDRAFRYGGEEFCVLMPATRAGDAAKKVEELLLQWRAKVFELDGATLREQSFSAGVADTTQAPLAPAALLRLADQRLLAAKRAGRCRVIADEGTHDGRESPGSSATTPGTPPQPPRS